MTITILENKRIILGVTGSIAAYKAADLASKLTQAGALVDVVMTQSAQQFVTPFTFQALTGRPVYTDLWAGSAAGSGLGAHIAHVGLGEGADLILIAPATANSMAKYAAGLADDLLSVTLLAARCPVMLAPAMDGAMYEHAATQANVQRLTEWGYTIIQPQYGRFASGLEGRGRLSEVPQLIGEVRRVLGRQGGGWRGRRVVVTAGGTREPFDPVRFISNHSSGKQGYALAQAALDAGADVTLISSARHLPVPVGAELIPVETAHQMRDAVLAHLDCDALIMAAAVADFRPSQAADQKIKKQTAGDTISLARNDDILSLVAERKRQDGRPTLTVGFAAETENLVANAQDKLNRKALDMIVANDLTAEGAGFGGETNRVTFITPGQEPQQFMPLATKARVAEAILARLQTTLPK